MQSEPIQYMQASVFSADMARHSTPTPPSHASFPHANPSMQGSAHPWRYGASAVQQVATWYKVGMRRTTQVADQQLIHAICKARSSLSFLPPHRITIVCIFY